MASVTFRDETAAGRPVAEPWEVAGLPDRMTLRELIRLRVREEVARHNARLDARTDGGDGRFRGLVQPAGAEAELNGGRPPEVRRPVVWERQADIAERAFATNGFFVLAGDRQVEELDDVVDLTTDPGLVFVKLVALVGG